MAVKLTISLPEHLAEFAKRLASETRRPRSRVFAELLESKRQEILHGSMIEGYRALAEENRRFADEAMPLAGEIWEEPDADD